MKHGMLKSFRLFLNQRYGFTDKRWGERGVFGAQKRLYGDYLYNQDRDMFNEMMERAYYKGREVDRSEFGEWEYFAKGINEVAPW